MRNQYDYADPVFSTTTGHITQVVWKATTKVGVAMADCPARRPVRSSNAAGQNGRWVRMISAR
ncbi:CAP domain-containing protein [Nocardia jinanensis]|uniref:SCP domain-containing protein n=1 Tax=Nocardia jinanensis TaxID=382504 RepID=A0A917RG97_9NOCA|nr:CAP domain-containing protein [Nocardia jinanensis]GGL05107.1 hypothetical protein GCM10011588_19520 [Nocardia jinanensis]